MKSKILLTFFIALLLILPLISAEDVGQTWDNIKSVDNTKMSLGYPTITIKNWLGMGADILETKITSNTPKCPNGKCNLEQTFNNYYDTASLEADRFVDAKGNEIKDIPISHYTYKTETYTEKEYDKYTCIEKTEVENNSKYQKCSWTYKDVKKTKQVKVPYVLGTKMLGNNIIGTDADISKYDFVD